MLLLVDGQHSAQTTVRARPCPPSIASATGCALPGSRHAMTTFAPALASTRVASAPSPLFALVTITVRPCGSGTSAARQSTPCLRKGLLARHQMIGDYRYLPSYPWRSEGVPMHVTKRIA